MKRPNILLLFTDQQRHDTIAALGNPVIRTPALDRLVREGTAFEHCYTPSPVCVAARCSLMTGQPPHKTGCFNNGPMPQDLPSFVERLAGLGYQTHGAGKMHFTPDHTRMWGFASRDISEELQESNNHFPQFLREHGFAHVEEPLGLRGEYYYIPQPSQLPATLHESSWVADRSMDFLRRRDRNRPFFLMSSFLKPHPPFESPTPWNRLYRAREMEAPFQPENPAAFFPFWNTCQNRYKYRGCGRDELLMRSLRAAYYGCISFVDFNIRRILATLGPEAGNTLIVFAADHGELLGDYGCFGKRTMQEASVRVPLIMRWPEGFAAGARVSGAVSLLDLYPTFLEAAGEKENPSPLGMSLLGTTAGGQTAHRTVISQFESRDHAQYLASDGAWKYAYSAPDRKELLIDLVRDPRETVNLADDPAQRDRLESLRGVLRESFSRDACTGAFDGDTWRLHPQPQLAADPDHDLIEQDPGTMPLRLAELGRDYTPPASGNNAPSSAAKGL